VDISGCCEIEHSEEAVGQLIVASDVGAVDLELTEHWLDVITLLVERLSMIERSYSGGLPRPRSSSSIGSKFLRPYHSAWVRSPLPNLASKKWP
jgi:hypothetical protein